jgi:SAM-dependent methyltransferase
LPALGTPPRIRLDDFLRRHATDRLTLDVGCGSSRYAGLFPNRVAVDVSPHPELRACADAHRLPFRDGTFEVVLCTEVLEHVIDPQRVVEELYRVLKPGGTSLLTTRFCYPIHDPPRDFYRYTRYGLEHLFKRWKIEELVEDSGGLDTLATLLDCFVGERRAVVRKGLKVMWLPLWSLCRRTLLSRHRGGLSRASALMPSGYHLVARKPPSGAR